MLQIDWVVHRQAQMRLDHNWTGLKSIITKPKVFHLFVWGVTRSSYVRYVWFWVPAFARIGVVL